MSRSAALTDATFPAMVDQRPGLVLVDFWAPWCPPCVLMGPVIDRTAATYAGSVKVVKLDVDANPVTADRFEIRSIPTLVLFRDGEEVTRMIGVVTPATLASALDLELAASGAAQ